MKKNNEDLLNELYENFIKRFKNGKEFQTFMDALFKRAVQQMLEGELDEHLGHDKHEKAKAGNTRNSKQSKTIKTNNGTYQIDVLKDRQTNFEPKLVLKWKRMIDHIEDIVISFYAKGMSTEDIARLLSNDALLIKRVALLLSSAFLHLVKEPGTILQRFIKVKGFKNVLIKLYFHTKNANIIHLFFSAFPFIVVIK